MKTQVAIVHRNPDHARVTLIDWTLGTFCNYECSYCPKHLHDGSHPWPDPHDVINLSRKIISHYEDFGRKTFFAFTGGEPGARSMRCIYNDETSETLGPRDLILHGAIRWRLWNCDAGIESLAVKPDGSMHHQVGAHRREHRRKPFLTSVTPHSMRDRKRRLPPRFSRFPFFGTS